MRLLLHHVSLVVLAWRLSGRLLSILILITSIDQWVVYAIAGVSLGAAWPIATLGQRNSSLITWRESIHWLTILT